MKSSVAPIFPPDVMAGVNPLDHTHDRYGRALFTVTSGGESVGAALTREGPAKE